MLGITITLRVRDAAALNRFLADVSNPQSPSYRHFLSPQRFAQQFAPDVATRSTVTSWLRSQGLQNVSTSANGLQISAEGVVSTVQAALGTTVDTFQQGPKTFFANVQPVRVPGSLAPVVLDISGLSNYAQQHPAPGPRIQQQSVGGYSPTDVKHLYNVDPLAGRGIDGTGQSIAIVSFADYNASDIAAFDRQFNISSSVIRISVSDGRATGGRLGAANGQDEAEADIELAQGLAPRAHILLYEAPNTSSGAIALFNRIVGDNRAAVVTSSWGGDESSYSQSDIDAIHQAVQEGTAQGQTFFSASGDSGAYDAAGTGSGMDTTLTVDYPASDPWVTGVGGTTLHSNGSQYVGETAWSDRSDPQHQVGSGGGLSTLFPRPTYQTGPGVINAYSNGMRQVPDVAANADPQTGYAVYAVGSQGSARWMVMGGTSGSSPVWASFAALANQSIGRRLGFLNPALYELGQRPASLPPSPFHDVTVGTNLYYPATSGWDFATGWGSFDAQALATALGTLPAPSATPQPTRTPSPAAAPATVAVTRVLILHRLSGKLQQTKTLKVGEKGTVIILYQSENAGSLKTQGTILIRQNGQAVKTLALTSTRYSGSEALTASIQFTSKKRVGTVLARVTVRLGTVSSALNKTFTIIPPK